jgi:hypothetical protein
VQREEGAGRDDGDGGRRQGGGPDKLKALF